MRIQLGTVDTLNRFLHVTSALPYPVDVHSGETRANGKSLMGLLSLDLTQPLEMDVRGNLSERQATALREFMAGEDSPYRG